MRSGRIWSCSERRVVIREGFAPNRVERIDFLFREAHVLAEPRHAVLAAPIEPETRVVAGRDHHLPSRDLAARDLRVHAVVDESVYDLRATIFRHDFSLWFARAATADVFAHLDGAFDLFDGRITHLAFDFGELASRVRGLRLQIPNAGLKSLDLLGFRPHGSVLSWG
jgi:hypothetical protein